MSVWNYLKFMAIEEPQIPLKPGIRHLQRQVILIFPYWRSTFYIKHKSYFHRHSLTYSKADFCWLVCRRWHVSSGRNQTRYQVMFFSPLSRKFEKSTWKHSVCDRSRLLQSELGQFDQLNLSQWCEVVTKWPSSTLTAILISKGCGQSFVKSKQFILYFH